VKLYLAALAFRNSAHGNRDGQRSITVKSKGKERLPQLDGDPEALEPYVSECGRSPRRCGNLDFHSRWQESSGKTPAEIRCGRVCPMGIQAPFNIPQTSRPDSRAYARQRNCSKVVKVFTQYSPRYRANTEIKVRPGEKLKQLKPENGFAGIHGPPPEVPEGCHLSQSKSKTKNYVKDRYNSITWR
jgi:hypothetical protein